jgi:hypothetical protein
MTADEYAAMMDDVARHFLGEPNAALSQPRRGMLRWGCRGSLSVNTKRGVFSDFETGESGGVIDFVMLKGGYDRDAAKEWLKNFHNGGNGADIGNGKDPFADAGIECTYDYVDETGKLLSQVCRALPGNKPRFWQRRPAGHGGWIKNLDGVRRVLFRLPQLVEAVERGMTILLLEGEKDVLTAMRLGFAATCNPGGADKTGSKWRSEFSEFLRGANVELGPDNDDVGWAHVNAVGNKLTGIAKSIRVLKMPKGIKDLSEWADAGGTAEQLAKMVEEAPTWVPPSDTILGDGLIDEAKAAATAAEDAILEAVAKARPGIDRAKKRKQAATQLHVSPRDIDEELEQRWPGGERVEAPLHGHWTVDPWPEVAEGDALLRDIIHRLRRHVIFSHDVALASALWLMFSWVHDDVATHSPILNINSAEPESGKSTLMSVISFLMPRCIASVDITRAALYRSIKIWQPSFCIDEFDDVLSDRNENKQELRSVINSGHERGQGVLRCIEPDYTPQMFSTFAPKAIGMVGRKLPPATLGRCIFIEMRRKKGSELVEKFHRVDDPDLASLRSRLQRWSADNIETLRNAAPPMPEMLVNRAADNWCLLFAIADLAGEEWGDKARAAALTIEGKNDKQSIGARALADIRRLFRDRGNPDCMRSDTIVAELVQDPEGPWAEYSRGKPLTQNKLAKLLGNFGVHSQNVQPEGMSQARGYKRVWLEEVWSRYLPDETANTGEGAL